MLKNSQLSESISFARRSKTLEFKSRFNISSNGINTAKPPRAIVPRYTVAATFPGSNFLHINIPGHIGICEAMWEKETAFNVQFRSKLAQLCTQRVTQCPPLNMRPAHMNDIDFSVLLKKHSVQTLIKRIHPFAVAMKLQMISARI